MNDYKNKITSLNLKSKPIFDIEDHLKYTKDWRGQYIGDAIAILKPHDKYEVSKILKFANENEISIVPQGGNTGLCGGATPLKNSFSIIISTEKMNNIISIDKESMTITLEPGVILSIIHDQVEKKDYPAIFITTGYHDSQVQYFEPAKWIARIRDRRTNKEPLLMYCNMDAGHGGASGRFDAFKETAMEYAFLISLTE